MTKRYSPIHCPTCAIHEDDYRLKPIEPVEAKEGVYVLHTSHAVTVNLYNKTLKNYKAVKSKNKELVIHNAQLLKRIEELEAEALKK
jgi:hypothetical protein